jgi:quercetin dioxygenase-like cupin family protein
MFDRIINGRALGRGVALAAIIVGCAGAGLSPAAAGECPADQVKANVRAPVTTPGKGVTDTVLTAIDLAKEPAKIQDRQLRLRKLVIEPGGVVPWHSHGDRPAIIYIIEGEIIEYASNCAVPVVHKAGDVTAETNPRAHWWENRGSKTVVLLSADVLHDKHDKHM